MAEPRVAPPRGTRESSLPVMDRFAPAPPEDQVRRWIGARSAGSDIVVELHGRGGWITRAAAEDLRRGYDLESTALTRLVAELVLRPPDLRHLDAAFTASADQQRGGLTLRETIERSFASRCGHCGGPVVVEEFVWDGDADAPTRRSYRCGHCRETRAGETRTVPVDGEDIVTARRLDPWPFRDRLIERFPVPHPDHELPDQLLDLYTARQLEAIVGVIDRIEGDLRAPGIEAALRLLLVGMLLPASKLNSFPGRVAQPRIVGGRLRPVGERQWRERNPWLLLEDGFRTIRGFVQRLEVGRYGTFRARFGPDLKALREAAANVVVRQGILLPPEDQLLPEDRGAARVRLVLTQPPVHWSPENLAFGYLATAIALGLDAALTLPLDAVFETGPRPEGRSEWARDASELYRSLAALRPQLGKDGTGVLLLDRQPAGAMVASVLGAVAAGYRLRDVTFRESGQDITGAIELTLPGGPSPVERDLPEPTVPVLPPIALDRRLRSRPTPISGGPSRHMPCPSSRRGGPRATSGCWAKCCWGLDRSGHLRRVTSDWAAAERELRLPRTDRNRLPTRPLSTSVGVPGAPPRRRPRRRSGRRRDGATVGHGRLHARRHEHGDLVAAGHAFVARPGPSGPRVGRPGRAVAQHRAGHDRLLDPPGAARGTRGRARGGRTVGGAAGLRTRRRGRAESRGRRGDGIHVAARGPGRRPGIDIHRPVVGDGRHDVSAVGRGVTIGRPRSCPDPSAVVADPIRTVLDAVTAELPGATIRTSRR